MRNLLGGTEQGSVASYLRGTVPGHLSDVRHGMFEDTDRKSTAIILNWEQKNHQLELFRIPF